MDLPVIDAYKFNTPSPMANPTGALETHLPIDIARPEFAGYHNLSRYLNAQNYSAHRTLVTEIANTMVGLHPNGTMKGIFGQLVKENLRAMQHAAATNQRILVALEPIEERNK